MAKTQSVKVDPKEMQRANEMWEHFTVWTKWGVIATVALLALMGLFLIDW